VVDDFLFVDLSLSGMVTVDVLERRSLVLTVIVVLVFGLGTTGFEAVSFIMISFVFVSSKIAGGPFKEMLVDNSLPSSPLVESLDVLSSFSFLVLTSSSLTEESTFLGRTLSDVEDADDVFLVTEGGSFSRFSLVTDLRFLLFVSAAPKLLAPITGLLCDFVTEVTLVFDSELIFLPLLE
jgi:hypothetical protein